MYIAERLTDLSLTPKSLRFEKQWKKLPLEVLACQMIFLWWRLQLSLGSGDDVPGGHTRKLAREKKDVGAGLSGDVW